MEEHCKGNVSCLLLPSGRCEVPRPYWENSNPKSNLRVQARSTLFRLHPTVPAIKAEVPLLKKFYLRDEVLGLPWCAKGLPFPFLHPLLLLQAPFMLCGCIDVPKPQVMSDFLPEVPRKTSNKGNHQEEPAIERTVARQGRVSIQSKCPETQEPGVEPGLLGYTSAPLRYLSSGSGSSRKSRQSTTIPTRDSKACTAPTRPPSKHFQETHLILMTQ